MQQASFYGSNYGSLNFDVSGAFMPSSMSQTSLGAQQPDLNSPEVFKQHIQLAQTLIGRIQAQARSALSGIQHAYHPQVNPNQTVSDIIALKQSLQMLVELLRQSGVGALPLDLSHLADDTRTESAQVEEEGKVVQSLYDRHKRIQDSAAVVAGFLNFGGGVDQAASSGAGRK